MVDPKLASAAKLFGARSQSHRHVATCATIWPSNRQRDRLARLIRANRTEQFTWSGDLVSVDGRDDVAFLDPRCCRRTAGLNLANTYDPDAMLIVGSINDSDVGLQPIAAAAYAAFAAARPDMPLIVAGPEPYDVFATPVATNNAVKAAALAAPNVLHYIDWYVDDWINGSGNTGAPAGDGNADWIIGVDGVHPNLAGFRYLGLMFAEALRGLPTTL